LYRIDYLRDHIYQLGLAIQDGSDLIGYCPWSAIDLISTHEGMRKRYGFIYVDRSDFDLKTLSRVPKDSFYWYKDVIASNGANLFDEKNRLAPGTDLA
jgi:6-phospho-beta-glucosidase